MIRPRLLLLTGCLLSAIAAIAPGYPAIAQTSYSLESWQGDVRLTRSGQREQRLTRRTNRWLDTTDQLRLQGRRSWVDVRCPGRPRAVRWDEVRQSRSVAEICDPSDTITMSRSTDTRNGDSDLWKIATCEFAPKTYFLPRLELFSWPRVDNARRYRVEWVDLDRAVVIWQTSTTANQLRYGGPRLTGRRYGLRVTAIGANNQPISTYTLNHVLPLPNEWAPTFARDWAEITGDRTLMPDGQRWARVDLALSVSRTEDDPELWWTVVQELSPEADIRNPTAHMRLALAYLYLNRGKEAQQMARRALAAIGRSPSAARAEALIMLAKASTVINDLPEAMRALTEARSIYQGQSETSQVEAIEMVTEDLRDRATTPCNQSQ
ncbi:tetratricopeptide repeat protein [Limnothrix redekei]|uniref:Tetratricopeptide repeat protein n=1 Tax=Limnothrix redekei LRLZ20PSL1 TaxID=3112953 RepID=A0ABW7CBI8_9CYAN